MTRRTVYGAIAAAASAAVALDATLGKPHNWPGFHKIFDGEWLVARNAFYIVMALLAAFFGYLALHHVKSHG
jgi:hypothetical protein